MKKRCNRKIKIIFERENSIGRGLIMIGCADGVTGINTGIGMSEPPSNSALVSFVDFRQNAFEKGINTSLVF